MFLKVQTNRHPDRQTDEIHVHLVYVCRACPNNHQSCKTGFHLRGQRTFFPWSLSAPFGFWKNTHDLWYMTYANHQGFLLTYKSGWNPARLFLVSLCLQKSVPTSFILSILVNRPCANGPSKKLNILGFHTEHLLWSFTMLLVELCIRGRNFKVVYHKL